MEQKERKPINYYMRIIHRDLGFFVIRLTIIFSLSGIVLIYRDTDFLKKERIREKQLDPNLDAGNLGGILRMRNFEIIKTEGDIVYFNNGNYNRATGLATYSEKSLPSLLDKMNRLHKKASKDRTHILSTVFGISLFFLAVSSFWLYKPQTRIFRRGMVYAALGFIIAIILLLLK